MNIQRSRHRGVRRFLVSGVVLIVLTILIAIVFIPGASLVLPDTLIATQAPWTEPVSAQWNGEGTVIGYFEDGDPMDQHSGWIRGENLLTGPFGNGRCVIVYLPPDYDPNLRGAYPVLYALHGFGRRPDVWVESLLPLVEEGIMDGSMPPLIVVMPDFSISGNGEAEGGWPGDGRAGSWYIDSNLGAYESFFFDKLKPWVESSWNTRTDSAGTALLGTSMGGFGALRFSLVQKDIASTIVAVYPMADLRYSISGSRLENYDSKRYSPIDRDRPRRAMMGLDSFGLLGVSEEFFIYQVFGPKKTDGSSGSVWPKDMPVWMRLESVNPIDILESEQPDLTGISYYLTAGDEDEFNFDDHLPILESALNRQGADVTVEITTGLKHGWWGNGNESYRREVIRWLGKELKASLDN